MKKNVTVIVGMVLVVALMLITQVSAYRLVCLTYGQSLPDEHNPRYTCYHDRCINICVTDSNNPTGPDKCSDLGACEIFGSPDLDTTPPNLTVISPSNGEVFNQRKVPLNLEIDEPSSLYYIDNINGRGVWKQFCSNCEDSYTNSLTFDEGFNDLTFKARDRNGNEKLVDRTFTVDSRVPRITKAEPRTGFANGDFYIEFVEDNPQTLMLKYGNGDIDLSSLVDLSACTKVRSSTTCRTSVNLDQFDGGPIEYYFALKDVAGNVDNSPVSSLDVDISDPIIHDLAYRVDGRSVYFTVRITEPYLEEVGYSYVDHNGQVREKKICSTLNGDLCEGKGTFQDGHHDITVYVRDKAGNMVGHPLSLFTDSKTPKISSVKHMGGFDPAFFEIDLIENNPERLTFNYFVMGSSSNHQVEIPLSECSPKNSNYKCLFDFDFTPYDGETVEYWFTLEDLAGNEISSRSTQVLIDVSDPIIESLDYQIDGKYVYFTMQIDEPNFEEAGYTTRDSRGRLKYKRFCSRLENGICEGKASFKDGHHTIGVYAEDKNGAFDFEEISFFIDSKNPRIGSVEPRRGLTSGKFSIEFKEDNPTSLKLFYGSTSDAQLTEYEVDLEGECTFDRDYSCEIDVDLDFNRDVTLDGESLEYYFELKDIVGNTATSKRTVVTVDITDPVLLNPESFWAQGSGRNNKYVYFNLEIDEENFDEALYFDRVDSSPRWKRLCSRLTDGVCEKRLSFRRAEHIIDIKIIDEAGNSITLPPVDFAVQ